MLQTRGALKSKQPSYDDLRVESAVLTYVAGHRGTPLTIPMLVRAMTAELAQDECSTSIERAIRELVRGRILICQGSVVRRAECR